MALISIVIPVLNEAINLPLLMGRLDAVHEELKVGGDRMEVVIVDDGSSDLDQQFVVGLCAKYPYIIFLHLTRNFGHQPALSAGIGYASGSAVITMDGDGQHPPELIPEMIEKWREGYAVVGTLRKTQIDAKWSKRILSSGFYAVMGKISNSPPAPGASDFRLVDRRVVQILNDHVSQTMFFRGLIPWLGFREFQIEFEAPARLGGSPSFTLRKSIHLALAGIVTYTRIPLFLAFGLAFGLAFILLVLSVIGFAYVLGLLPEIDLTPILLIVFAVSMLVLTALALASLLYSYRAFREAGNQPLFVIDRVFSSSTQQLDEASNLSGHENQR